MTEPKHPATLALDEWSDSFRMTIEYEVQVTGQMLVWLREMKAEGCRDSDLVDELSTRLHGDRNVNIVDARADSDDMTEVLGV